MWLHSITLSGYKRFADAWINLSGRTVAIVGPNEAGKSALLQACLSLSDDSGIPVTALTRDKAVTSDAEVVRARFRLTEHERTLVPGKLQADQGVWLIVAKSAAGPRTFRLEPRPVRNKEPRARALDALKTTSDSPWFRAWELAALDAPLDGDEDEDETGVDQSPGGLARSLLLDLNSEGETLAPSVIEAVRLVRHELLERGGPSSKKSLRERDHLAKALADLWDEESAPHPNEVPEALKALMPEFIEFDEDERELRSEYDLADPGELQSEPLRNLAAMAGLELESLRDAIASGDAGRVRSLQERAQRELAGQLRDAWRQSPLTVSFDRDATALRITVSSHEDEFFSLADRSDGMRMFLALRAFLAQKTYRVPPILLVDEAETHLHYDAQADLIRLFEQQQDVAQVIYTTHSIGCLPQDLGRGVRVVSPIPNSTRSTVENVWCREGAGVSPLMLAMGASTVPLAPSRFVVIAEGPSDAMLLPSLIRDATSLGSLEFQVLAGISEASDDELSRLDLEAPRVAYVLDGDAGGTALAKRLAALGIPSSKIVRLSPPSRGVVLEDLLEPGLYVRAVNQYLGQWPPFAGGFGSADVPRTGRVASLGAWCARNSIPTPSKLRVAEEVVRILEDPDPESEPRISDPTRRDLLKSIHDQIRGALGAPTALTN